MGRTKKIVEKTEELQTLIPCEDTAETEQTAESVSDFCESCQVPIETINPVEPTETKTVLKVKLVSPTAKLPERANPTDAGADLFATSELVIGAKDSKFMDLGIQMEIPEGMAGFMFARSGLGGKGIRPRNCVGVIDSKYRGNLGCMIENNADNTYRVSTGDRIAQLVIMPVECLEIVQADELDMANDRGGGFGHTGV